MTLTESLLLQARIAEMSNLEFDEWLESLGDNYDQGYNDGERDAESSYSDGYIEGYSDGLEDRE